MAVVLAVTAWFAGCAGVRPAEAEVSRGLATIMVDQGLSADGAQLVAACVSARIYPSSDPVSLQRLARGEHAVLPKDERMVSAAETQCILSAG